MRNRNGGSMHTDLNTILIVLSAVFTALIGPYIIYRLNKQDKQGMDRDEAIARVEVNVDGRLTETITEMHTLRTLVETSQRTGDPVPESTESKSARSPT